MKRVRGIKSLAEARPDFLPDWDYEKNDCSPEDIPFGSSKRVHWKCHVCGYEWMTSVNQRTATAGSGMGCKMCSKSKRVVKCKETRKQTALLPQTFNCTLTKFTEHIPTTHLKCPTCSHIWEVDPGTIPPYTDIQCPECNKKV